MTKLLTNIKPNLFFLLEIDLSILLSVFQENIIYILVTVGIRLIEYYFKRKKNKKND